MNILALLAMTAWSQEITGIEVEVPDNPVGVVVAFHGRSGENEAWIENPKMKLYRNAFVDNHFAFVSLDGEEEDSWSCPTCVDNILNPVLDSLFKHMPERIIYIGFSAGGWPARTRAFKDTRAEALILLNSGGGGYVNAYVHSPQGIPVFMTAGSDDETVPYSKIYCRALYLDKSVEGISPLLYLTENGHMPNPGSLEYILPNLGLTVPSYIVHTDLIQSDLRPWRSTPSTCNF